jgi:hypothetical protein
MSEVVSQISEYMVRLGHDVTVATQFDKNRKSDVIKGVKIKSFKISGNLVVGIKGEPETYIEFIRNQDFSK